MALFLFAFLAVVKDAFGRGADIAGADRLVIINRVSIIQPLPLSYRDKILRIPGVKAVTHNNWFGGVYQDEKNFFPQFVIDAENQRQVIPELIVPDDQWNNFVKDRQGAVVGAGLAKRFGWKIGDRIPIKNALFGGASHLGFQPRWHLSPENGPRMTRPSSGFSGTTLKNACRRLIKERSAGSCSSSTSLTMLRVSPRRSTTMFANSPYETKTETESAFAAGWVKQFGNIEFLILTIGAVVFFTLLLVTGNTMAISVRERTGGTRRS